MNVGRKNEKFGKQRILYFSLKMEAAGLTERLVNSYHNTRRGAIVVTAV
jgi:hypothetical protein